MKSYMHTMALLLIAAAYSGLNTYMSNLSGMDFSILFWLCYIGITLNRIAATLESK